LLEKGLKPDIPSSATRAWLVLVLLLVGWAFIGGVCLEGTLKGGLVFLRGLLAVVVGLVAFSVPFLVFPHPFMFIPGGILAVAAGSWVFKGKAEWLHK